MHLINRDTDYAIRILKLISRNPEHTHDARTLSQELGMPRPFLRKILQRLGNKGLLLSSRGRNGGFGLGRPAGSIFINDLLLLFQEGKGLVHCDGDAVPCGTRGACLLHKRLKEMENDFQKHIGGLSIQSLMEAEG
jgi:Rrf2 family nitric oxide-sensitive transcriptional repressor